MKKLIKVLSFFTAAVMLLSMLPCVSFAATTAYGKCGENLTWVFEDNGTLAIAGTGDMTSWSRIYDIPWYSHCAYVKSAMIGDGVTSIGDLAFRGCYSLTSIELPDSVTSIGAWAFRRCDSLTSIEIPGGVTNIGEGAFAYCYSLTSIGLPGSVTSIGEGAFSGCGINDVYYGGSEADWNNISIGSGNEYLQNAVIHYNISVPVEVVKSGEFEEGIKWTLDSEGDFVVTLEDTLLGRTAVLIGCSASGEMKISAAVNSAVNSARAKINTDGVKTVKILVWGSIESMKPVCEAKTVEITVEIEE